MVFTVYCLYCNVSGLVVLLLNKFDLILFDLDNCWGTSFGRGAGAPNKIWEGKNVQNSARFLTIFDSDRKCRQNENLKSTFYPLLGEKNLVNFGPQTKKL